MNDMLYITCSIHASDNVIILYIMDIHYMHETHTACNYNMELPFHGCDTLHDILHVRIILYLQ